MVNLNNPLKKSSYQVALAIILIGLGAGVFSFLLHESVALISGPLGTLQPFTYKTFIIASACALGSYFLTKFVFKDTQGSGIPQVKLALTAHKGKMPKRMPFGKFITTFLTLCSGLAFGKEGPMVTISAAWANLISHFFKLGLQMNKVLVASGATAGLAAAFNTPIAAVVFTIEEILGEMNTRFLGPIIVTSVVASVTSYKLLGNRSTFIPLDYQFHVEWHLLLYLVLGLVMSLVGLLFVKAILFFKNVKNQYFKRYDFLYVVAIIGLAGVSSHYSFEVLGDGVATINQLLAGNDSRLLVPMLLFFLIKILISSTSYSTGLSGGIFMPVLCLGAIGGTFVGHLFQKLGVSHIEVGVFALLGMTSLLVSVIKTPFTAFVMLFEMTRDYELILPLMISSIGAHWISNILSHESVYESVAEYEGVHLPTPADNECLNEMIVRECMVKDVFCLKADMNIENVMESVEQSKYSGFPVIRNDKLIGVVNRCELKEKLQSDPKSKVIHAAKYSVISIYPDQSLLIALDKMKRFEISRLPVVSRFNDKKLIGLVTPEDIINFLGLSKQENQGPNPNHNPNPHRIPQE